MQNLLDKIERGSRLEIWTPDPKTPYIDVERLTEGERQIIISALKHHIADEGTHMDRRGLIGAGK